ncbi:hypothetical protein HDU76_005031 [Blyttiomyces sp. JEL0837]|nr:hypothetical protein HDU76_005031 [Blyttiomyces sp. JEL0837]
MFSNRAIVNLSSSASSSFLFRRMISSSSTALNQPSPELSGHSTKTTESTISSTAPPSTPLPTSSCKEGTVLKGINIYAGKSDPVAKPDSEYPEWLFRILDNHNTDKNMVWPVEMQLQAKYVRLVNREKIRANSKAAGIVKR